MPAALRRFAPLLNLVAATFLLMATAFADGRPSIFYDSGSYWLSGKNVEQIVQNAPESLRFKMKPGLDIGDDPVASDDDMDPAMMGARSATYGIFMRGLWQLGRPDLLGQTNQGSLWLLAAVQAFMVAWVLRLLWRSVAPKAPAWSYLALVGGLTLFSTLPFFTTFAMPDVFAGVESAAIVLVMLYADRLKRWETGLLLLLLVACMSFHGSDPILAVPLVIGSALIAWRLGARWSSQLVRGGLIAMTVILGVGMTRAYVWAFDQRTGWDLRPPPFVTARLLVDGTGKRYLLKHCTDDSTPFAVCRYRFQAMTDTDTVLWSDEYTDGVFNISDAKTRHTMELEEPEFAFAVLLDDPIGQALISTRDWLQQLGMFWVEDPIKNPMAFLTDSYWGSADAHLKELIPDVKQCKPYGPGCAPPFYVIPLAIWHGLWLLGGLAFLGWRLSRKDVLGAVFKRRPDWSSPVVRLFAASVVMIAAVLINAAICGVFSGTFTRYQGRIVWLAPLAAGLVACVLQPKFALAWALRRLNAMEGRLRALIDRARIPGWAQPIAAKVTAHPLARRVNARFLQFAMVGGFGFVVDSTLVQLLVLFANMEAWLARLPALAIAIFATWVVNRTWTFRDHADDARRGEEASAYFAVQAAAAAVNVAVYWALLRLIPAFDHGLGLYIPMFIGAASGLGLNYVGSRRLVFRQRAEAQAPAAE